MSNKPMTMKKRYVIVMLIGFVLNEFLHQIANMFHLPVWLDTTGTALVAVILGPTAALIVGLANNMILALFYYNARSLFFYAASASIAIIVGTLIRKDDKIKLSRIPIVMVLCMIIPSILSGLITLWETAGQSTSVWEWHYTQMAMSAGIPIQISCIFGALMLKIPDVIIETILIVVIYKLLPSKIKHPSVKEVYAAKESKDKLILELEAKKRYKDEEKKRQKHISETVKKAKEDQEKKKVDEIMEEVSDELDEDDDD